MDAVITYVNGADKHWQQQYNKFVKKPIEEARYRDWGTMPYLVKGIRKFMTYINKIFIVVADEYQIPVGVDLNDVTIVYHKDIIPAKYLPCFNSDAIEMFIPLIAGLGEQFVYFNDDTFVVQPSVAEDFFVNGKPVLNPKINTYGMFDTFNCFTQHCINSTNVILNKFDIKQFPKMSYLVQEHRMRPFLKSSCMKVLQQCNKEISASLTRVRHEKNINSYVFNNYDYLTGNYVIGPSNYKIITTSSLIDVICNNIEKPMCKFICLNDNSPLNYYANKERIYQSFNKTLKMHSTTYGKLTQKYNVPISIQNSKVALCAIAKNENLYIREWVDWYLKLGIEKIFLYDNNELDGERFEDVINDYIKEGYVEIINKRGVEKGLVYDEQGINLQTACYIDCYENRVKDFDWVCFFDIDEFLVFKNEFNLTSFLSNPAFNEADTICVSWEHYDDNDLLYYENKPVTERFTRISKFERYGVKSIVRTGKELYDKTVRNLIHCFRLKDKKVYYANGETLELYRYNIKTGVRSERNWWLATDEMHKSSPVVLNHYKTKSTEEYIKRHLGRHWGTSKIWTDTIKDIDKCIEDYFNYNNMSPAKIEMFNKYR